MEASKIIFKDEIMRISLTKFLLGFWILLTSTSHVYVQAATDQWLPLPNTSMEIISGSALDLSEISQRRVPPNNNNAYIIANGEFFEATDTVGKKVRFFTATLGFGPNNGGFPNHATSDRLALMIKRNGYNAVRVHSVESMLMTNRKQDFDFDPEQLDRLYYLIASLRKQGMYFFVDMLGSWNGAYGDVVSHRWTRGQHDVTLGSLLPGKEQDHWLAMVKALWARKNPYTGISTLQDPAVAGVILVNEGETDFLLRNEQHQELAESFREYLIEKYRAPQAVEQAVGKSLNEIVLPQVSEKSALGREFQLFTTNLQINQFNWMRSRVQELGFKGEVTSFNAWSGYHVAASRHVASFVDMHQYADHPMGGMVDRGVKLNNGRLLDGKNRYLDKLAWSRQFGRPYTVTEYGQPFWNPFRWEVAPFTAAYARLQDWSLIAHFGNSFSLTRPASGKWRSMLTPFEVGTDPTLRAGETIAAFLYGRGDVMPSGAKLALKVDSKEAAASPADRFVSWQLAQMQYVLGVGLKLVDSKKNSNLIQRALEISTNEDGISTNQIYKKLLDSKTVEPDNWTSPSMQRYRSSTGELKIDLKQHTMTVVTKGSVGLLGSAGSRIESPQVSIKLDDGEGSVFVSDLGNGNLNNSNRALLVISTDSRNTGMTFTDSTETTLDRIGSFPARIKDASVTVEMAATKNNKDWRLFALSFTGKRTKELIVKKLPNGRAQAQVKLSSLVKNVTPYFEWALE